jgi:hypothetical protein
VRNILGPDRFKQLSVSPKEEMKKNRHHKAGHGLSRK